MKFLFVLAILYIGYYLYASSRNSEVLLLSSVINESFCQISFSYLLAQTAELTVLIEGLGVAWSSVEVPRISAWSKQSIRVDLRDAEIIPNRTMSLVARVGGGASLYAALDNLTMHPCIDCNTPGKMGFIKWRWRMKSYLSSVKQIPRFLN